jgi:hypothetical protein
VERRVSAISPMVVDLFGLILGLRLGLAVDWF